MAKKSPPTAIMLKLIIGYWVSRLIYVAAKLELADRLNDGPRTVEELAVAAGVFEETKDRRFKLTPLAATLRTGVTGSMRAMAMMMVENYWFDAWNQLLHGVKAGELPFLKTHGVPIFEYLEQHPEDLQLFGESMTSVSGTENPAIAAAYKFSGLRTLVDVAGGHGSLMATILTANPKLRGVLFDQPFCHCPRRERSARDRERHRGTLHARIRRLLRVGAEGRRCLHHEVYPPRLGR